MIFAPEAQRAIDILEPVLQPMINGSVISEHGMRIVTDGAKKLVSALIAERLLVPFAESSIHIVSKTKHSAQWRVLRDADGEPIISSWINETREGEKTDWNDLWDRCISEAGRAAVTIVYHEPGETLKGRLVEVGAALANNRTVVVVGEPGGTWLWRSNVIRAADMKDAIARARAILPAPPPSNDGPRSGEGK